MKDLSEHARAVVEAGRAAADPPLGSKERVRAALAAKLAAPPRAEAPPQAEAPSAPEPLPGPGATGLVARKVVLGALLAGLIGGAIWLGAGAAPEDELAGQPAVESPMIAPAPPPAPAPAPPPASVEEAVPAVDAPASAPPVVAAAPEERPADDPPKRAASSPKPPKAARRPPAAPARAPTAAPSPAPVADELAEVRWLSRAQRLLREGDAVAALALAEDHARQFPRSRYGVERATLEALALCQLGRADEARAAAAPVLRDHPNSPSAQRLRESCAKAQ